MLYFINSWLLITQHQTTKLSNIFIQLRINVMLWLRDLVILAEQKGYKCYNWQKFFWDDVFKKHSDNNRFNIRYRFPRCIETFELEIGFKSETTSVKHQNWRFGLSFQDWELFITLLMWMVSIPITSNVMWTNYNLPCVLLNHLPGCLL